MCGDTGLVIPACSTYLRRIFHAPIRDSGLPRALRNRTPFPSPFSSFGPQLAQIDRDRANRSPADRHEALLRSLSEHAHQMILQHHIAHAERDPFRDAKAGAVGQLEHRAVAKGQRLVERRRGEQLLDFVDAEHFGQRAPALRRLEALARIAHDVAFAEQEFEVACAPRRRCGVIDAGASPRSLR